MSRQLQPNNAANYRRAAYMQPAHNATLYNPRSPMRPQMGQYTQSHAPQPRRRRGPEFPVEIWEKIIAFVPRRGQLMCLLVCRMFYTVTLRFLLGTVSIHLEQETCYFDNGGQWDFIWRSREGTPIDTALQCNRLLWRIARDPNWARNVRTLILFMEDKPDIARKFALALISAIELTVVHRPCIYRACFARFTTLAGFPACCHSVV